MADLDWVRSWVDEAPFSKVLGIRVDKLSTEEAVLSLPFSEDLSNGDTALHGGVSGSAIVASAGCIARAALGAEANPCHTSAVQVAYLSAALGEGISATAKLMRKGKELAHVEVDVTAKSGKPVAKGLLSVRGRFGAPPAPSTPPSAAQSNQWSEIGPGHDLDPGPMGPYIGSIPFHSTLGISAEHMAGGMSRIVMPERPSNAGQDGSVHEGAILSLIDTTGAMSAWAETGPGRFKASTPGLQARILDPNPRGDLVGLGRVVHHDKELLFCDVEIRYTQSGVLVADGTVNYRIVTP
jgi:uncharacterized protein (TIGR00369 family)